MKTAIATRSAKGKKKPAGNELVDIQVEEVSLVGSPANKTPFLLYKSAAVPTAKAVAPGGVHGAISDAMTAVHDALGQPDGSLDDALFALSSVVGALKGYAFRMMDSYMQAQYDAQQAAKASGDVTPGGEFVGGFEGCVTHMMSEKGLPEENARKLCAFIGRQAGRIP